jgi:hypothetical protein
MVGAKVGEDTPQLGSAKPRTAASEKRSFKTMRSIMGKAPWSEE